MPGTSDILIVGGTLSGCTAAVLLAQQGLRVTVLEQHRDPGHYERACTH
ncbi:FAD-dependent oxidoreductase [Geodermatophilus sp. URMC 65]